MRKKTGAASPLLSSHRLRLAFAFRRNLSNLLERNTIIGEGVSLVVQGPFHSPRRDGIRIWKSLGTFWITLPTKKSAGESRL